MVLINEFQPKVYSLKDQILKTTLLFLVQMFFMISNMMNILNFN